MSHNPPKHVEAYATQGYWEERYGHKGGAGRDGTATAYYDWFQGSYSEFMELVLGTISPFDLILNVGCGDSRLSLDLLAKNMNLFLFNVDYAESVINHMHRQTSSHALQCWLPMDIRRLGVRDGSMDVVIDKGTIDALFSDGSSPWAPSTTALGNVEVTIRGIWRALRDGGRWICMSFGQPHFRRQYLETMEWKEKKVIPLGIYHIYMYTK